LTAKTNFKNLVSNFYFLGYKMREIKSSGSSKRLFSGIQQAAAGAFIRGGRTNMPKIL
jgi:hypothetical protein